MKRSRCSKRSITASLEWKKQEDEREKTGRDPNREAPTLGKASKLQLSTKAHASWEICWESCATIDLFQTTELEA